MSKKERIAELERRVALLEAAAATVVENWTTTTAGPPFTYIWPATNWAARVG